MKAIETLRRHYKEMAARDAGLPQRKGGYTSRVFVGHATTPADVVKILQLPVDTSLQHPLQDPVTGELFDVPGLDPPGTRPMP